jgi:hypothetical protein
MTCLFGALRHRSAHRRALVVSVLAIAATAAADDARGPAPTPLVIERQGSFLVGGTVLTNPGTFDPRAPTPAGQTIHADHAYVQYQIPANARQFPLVMWHGGGQSSKTWETTPDGREGFQTLFLRRGFATYLLDQPRRGRAGRTSEAAVRVSDPGLFGEESLFTRFRIGVWPDYFPNVQFSRDPAALDQWWRQQTPDTGPGDDAMLSNAVAALFEKIGPGVLLTHSASGLPGWLTAMKSGHVRAVVAYEPVGWTFPDGEMPSPVPTAGGSIAGTPVPTADFDRLTGIAVQLVYGDNIPESPSPYQGLDMWRGRLILAKEFVRVINAHGGHAELLHLPVSGVRGNTHFPFADLNNLVIADRLSDYLHRNGLDKR